MVPQYVENQVGRRPIQVVATDVGHTFHRYALNMKGLAYKTVWVDFCDIQQEMEKIGAPFTDIRPDGTQIRTVPTIHDPATGKTISDSLLIAAYLDEQYPSDMTLLPPYTGPLQMAFIDRVVAQWVMAGFPNCALSIHDQLSPRSQEWFRERREKMLGMTLEAFVGDTERQTKSIEHVVNLLNNMAKYFTFGGKESLFLTGDKPCHADIALASVLACIVRVKGEDSEVWKAITTAKGGRWKRYMEGFKKWETVH